MAWLRRLLACNLADAARARGRARRDTGASPITRGSPRRSRRPVSRAGWQPINLHHPSAPSSNEAVVWLAEALARLPDDNRRALVMRHCQGASLAEISAELDRTPQAVAGLLKRGLAELRTLLPDDRE